jgi:hypothetical protein
MAKKEAIVTNVDESQTDEEFVDSDELFADLDSMSE